MSTPIRLQKYIAQCGVASRRKAEELIEQGRITVDGTPVRTRGVKVTPGVEKVCLDGKVLAGKEEHVYILLNKPKGYVTTLSDPQGRPIVTSLLDGIEARVFPVGRLDFDTEGALILTNDGAFAQSIQHPSKEVKKTYEAEVYGFPSAARMRSLAQGIMLEGKMTSPAQLTLMKRKARSSFIKVVIHEGRKRQVRKMFQAIGHPVVHLKRLAYGKLFLRKLPAGKYRILRAEELKNIFL